MPPRLLLADDATARDALTFAARAAHAGAAGVRLQASGGILALTAAILAPEGLLDQTPTVLGMRIVRADPELECDLVVASLSASDDPRALALPETAIAPAWAGIAPPRSGWNRTGEIPAGTLAERARWGASAVAHAAPTGTGEAAVSRARAQVWGEPDPELGGLPRGMAFAADVLGFLGDGDGDGEVAVATVSDRWTRLALVRGHVLTRTPVAGLTAVRRTGG